MYRYELDKKERENPFYQMKDIDDIQRHNDPKQFISLMSSMSYTYGNALAYMQNQILDLFPDKLFKTIHVNSKIAHRQMRSTNHEFVKKAKPMIIFRPRIASPDEDRFLKGTPLIERQYNIHSTWGATSLQPFFNDEKHGLEIKYQQNRSVMYIDVILTFATLMQQIDYVHYLENATPWDSPQITRTCFESYLPQEMLSVISNLSGVPIMNETTGSTKEFLDYLQENSDFPITYKLQGASGNKEFYRYYPTAIDYMFSDLTWDEGERAGQVMNQYQISFSVRMEFYSTGFYQMYSNELPNITLPIVDTDDSRLIPIFTDVLTKEDLNLQPGWHLYSKASCSLETGNDVIEIDELLNDSIRRVIDYYNETGLPLMEILDVKVRQQGKLIHNGQEYTFDPKARTITFNNQNTYYTYRILISTNIEEINNTIKRIFNLN